MSTKDHLQLEPGDLVLFANPNPEWGKTESALDWEQARIGLIVEVSAPRPNDRLGNELTVMHEGERWSVPSAWCRRIPHD